MITKEKRIQWEQEEAKERKEEQAKHSKLCREINLKIGKNLRDIREEKYKVRRDFCQALAKYGVDLTDESLRNYETKGISIPSDYLLASMKLLEIKEVNQLFPIDYFFKNL